jgi:hypothetical protein
MNDEEQFETELKQLKPARPPEELMSRLASGGFARSNLVETRSRAPGERTPTTTEAFGWLRWLLPGTALAGAACLVAVVLWHDPTQTAMPRRDTVDNSSVPPLKADDVQIDRRLVASFDAVARLPDGAPLRVRCREWADKVVVVDSGNGVVIEQTQPRLEVVPVDFEVY